MCSIVISKAKRLLPLFLLPVLTMTVPSVSASAQPAELQPEYTEVQRDSAVVFRFVPGRLMFYYHYKDNETAIPKADSIIKANMDAILRGDAFIRIKGFCTSWPTDAQNRDAAKNRSNQVKSWYITNSGMREEFYRTVNSTVPDTLYSQQGGADLVALLYVEKIRKPVRPPFIPVPGDVPQIQAGIEYSSGLDPLRREPPCPVPSQLPADETPSPALPSAPSGAASTPKIRKPLIFNVKTNLLYDAVGFPSLEVEIPIGKRFSINAEGAVAWWSGKKRDTFYQLDMLSPEVRWWFGQKSRWQGHYVGAFGAVGLYDLEWRGSRGYQGNYWSAGLSYGYMFPITKRLSLEAGIGLGVLNTEYEEYLPIDEHYVYQQTSRTVYWGPVKLKLGLVWRIGDGSGKTRRAAL